MAKIKKIKQELIMAEDLMAEDIVWVDKTEQYDMVNKVDFNLNGDVIVTFDMAGTIIYKPKIKLTAF